MAIKAMQRGRGREDGRVGIDAEVVNGDVRIATTDFAGPGPTLVLMPGLGSKRRGMAKLVDHLPDWRIVTMDLRGHGDSTTGTFDFESVIADLDAVIAHYELNRPIVGGHSLGGMIALKYALAKTDVIGVVNIDGWGPGIPERYVGEDVDEVRALLDRIADEGVPSRLGRTLIRLTRQGREGTADAVFKLLRDADVIDWHAQAPCPSLAFNATSSKVAILGILFGGDMPRLTKTHRRGLSRDLAELAQNDPTVSVTEVDATHMVHVSHPAVVAAAIDAFRETIES